MAPVVVIVTKPYRESKLGISLTTHVVRSGLINNKVGLQITSISDDGLFAGKSLEVGMVVSRINGVSCNGMDAAKGYEILESAEGQITIIADKLNSHTTLRDNPPKVFSDVAAITNTTIFGSTGDFCANRKVAPSFHTTTLDPTGVPNTTTREAASEVSQCVGSTPDKSAGPVVALVTKSHQEEELGIGLKRQTGLITISSLKDDGLFANTALRVGMFVWSINGVDCNMDESEAVGLLKIPIGVFAIVASEFPPNTSITVATPIFFSDLTVAPKTTSLDRACSSNARTKGRVNEPCCYLERNCSCLEDCLRFSYCDCVEEIISEVSTSLWPQP